MVVRAGIPSFHQVESGEHGRHYTVYLIEVFVSGKCHKIERRYRAFHNLHKQLRRVMQTPEFPPKKMRNSSPKLLEQRRVALEKYLQGVLQMKPVPKQLQQFLSIPDKPMLPPRISLEPSPSGSSLSLDQMGTELGMIRTHQPVLTFVQQPYTELSGPGFLPDIVVKGVLMGLYADDDEDNDNCFLR